MKIFQILNGFCHKDYSHLKTLAECRKLFAPTIHFVEAPDFVFEGWGYDESKSGNEKFLKPIPAEGFGYDEETGTFYKLWTGKEKREQQYMEKTCINYDNQDMTVDQAEQYAIHYFFEDDEESQKKVAELKALITQAKEEIRQEYPDENEPYK